MRILADPDDARQYIREGNVNAMVINNSNKARQRKEAGKARQRQGKANRRSELRSKVTELKLLN